LNIHIASQEPGASRGLLPVIRKATELGHAVHLLSRLWATTVFRDVDRLVSGHDEIADPNRDVRSILSSVRPDVVLTGLAGAPRDSLDLATLAAAKVLALPRAGLLDASMYYSDRVAGPNGEPFHFLPDRIFVLNEFTRAEMIAEGFPPGAIRATGQPVYDYLADPMPPRSASAMARVAFFSEDLAAAARRRPEHGVGYTEDAAIAMLIDVLAEISRSTPLRLTIKRHPKEAVAERAFDAAPNFSVVDVSGGDPVSIMFDSDLVCGMSSSILLEAWLAGKPVVSIQPGLASWNRLVLCRAGILPAATDRHKAVELVGAGVKGALTNVTPLQWCPTLGRAAQRIVEELSLMIA
jgi:hypothetical protein